MDQDIHTHNHVLYPRFDVVDRSFDKSPIRALMATESHGFGAHIDAVIPVDRERSRDFDVGGSDIEHAAREPTEQPSELGLLPSERFPAGPQSRPQVREVGITEVPEGAVVEGCPTLV